MTLKPMTTVPLGATDQKKKKKKNRGGHKKSNRSMLCPQLFNFCELCFLKLNLPFVFPVWTYIFHAWALQGYTLYSKDCEPIVHNSIVFSNTTTYKFECVWWCTRNFAFVNMDNKFALLPTNSRTFPPLGATRRHWATSHKTGSHRW